MNRMTFIGRTTREAMHAARARFGPEVEIVGSRQVPQGVELTARVAARAAPSALQQATAERPMSTVSFEEFVRKRQDAARRPAVQPGRTAQSPVAGLPLDAAQDPGAVRAHHRAVAGAAPAGLQGPAAGTPRAHDPVAVGPAPETVPARPAVAPSTEAAARRVPGDASQGLALMQELQSIKRFIAGQLETVRWFDATRRRPSQLRVLRRLLACGFSPMLSRSLCDLLPVDFDDPQADRWLQQTLASTLGGFNRGPAEGSIFDAGGVFALTGPTGVGKTTSVAKIAARYALTHGAAGVALITADVYRIGAQDQLRSFGRLLGVPVHVAHDRAALSDLLGLFGDRKLVLIDTAGLGQRDERVSQLLSALDLEPIQRVLVLNASMQAAGLQDVVAGYRAQAARAVLVSKTDEAVQLGPVVDALVRNRLPLAGVCDGQRVPEDFHAPEVASLVARALAGAPDDDADAELAAGELRLILEGGHV
ncbi:MAG: flagellar biosynthesis protein FlhF [Lautropia sp.]